MKKVIIISSFLIFSSAVISQTVVRLEKPQQPVEPVTAYTLFDESLPTDVTTAIGKMGYYVTGGTEPYSFQWLENDRVIAEGDVADIIPSSKHNYYMRVVDKNNCTSIVSVNIAPFMPGNKNASENNEDFVFKITRSYLLIEDLKNNDEPFKIRLFDISGQILLDRNVLGESRIPISLISGVYILQVKTPNINKVYKAIVQ